MDLQFAKTKRLLKVSQAATSTQVISYLKSES